MGLTKVERTFRMTQITANNGGQFTKWICPNRFRALNVFVQGVTNSTVSLQRRAKINRDRGLYVKPGTVRRYAEDFEDSIQDFGTGVEYRLGIEPGNHGTDNPKLTLWG